MTDGLKVYCDPRCPWSYQTNRWAWRLEDLGEVELDWGFQYPNFSELERSRNGRSDLPGWNFPAAQRTFGNKIWMSATDARNW